VEAFSRAIIKRKLCPMVTSDVLGTPDLKFMGIFSENRLEWFMTELASCSDSICIIPIAIENQFLNENRIADLINTTELSTMCVSRSTVGVILDLKSKEKLPKLKNLILYD
jgi:long-chain acyl-CoA synthetase